MAKIAYILLCHKDPDAVIRMAERLTAVGDYMAIHFDASADATAFARIEKALSGNENVTFPAKRIKCGWGEWSLVQATLNTLTAALEAFPKATHFYMLSGDCMPIKSAEYTHQFLDAQDADFIESYDFFNSDWIKTGWKEERLIYRHFVNEREHRSLFYFLFEAQKRLGLTRKIPDDLQIMIGSQWWCLRRNTIENVLQFMDTRRDIVAFFRTTWIPDETFFQTLVRHLIPETEISTRTLTFLMFTDYGMPVTFYNDHYELLLSQDYLFARKISPEASDLKRRLGLLYIAQGVRFQISNEGRNLFHFLATRGRIGQRFAPRFWEKESTLGRERELLIVVCKKWHVAKRVLARIQQVTDVPTIAYLFNETDTDLPDLGGLENTLDKRHRHRRALMRMLFEYYETDRLMICMDPESVDLLRDFNEDRSVTRILEIECQFTDDYLTGHAMRVGLAGDQTSAETLERLLPTIRNDLMSQSDHIRDGRFEHFTRIHENADPEVNADALVPFLSISRDNALAIARTEYLFSD